MIIQGSHAPCSIPYHFFFPNRMLIGKLMFPLRLSKTYPSFLNLKEGSTFLTKPLFPQEREDVTALLGAQNRYAIRLADHQRSSPDYAGWDRLDAGLSIPNLKPHLHGSAKRKD